MFARVLFFFFFQAEDGIRVYKVTGVQTCALPICRHKMFFLSFAILGIVLRWYFLHWHFLVAGDSFTYGDLAKNWLLHGVYGVADGDQIVPVNMRMPGYPAFLAVCFRLFGLDHYGAVVRVQLVIDVLTCFLFAACARRPWCDRAA